ncbi:hypothetical protein [Microbacterium enclense]|uniref:hypothetical protein n=1 Tax=Microbacterium enclense TaxID=993073 RepID=UPI003F7FAEF7
MGKRRHTHKKVDMAAKWDSTMYTSDDCPTRKRSWRDRAAAKKAAKNMRGQHMNVYVCEHCSGFHLGHLPSIVIRGVVERSAITCAPRAQAATQPARLRALPDAAR